LKHMQVPELGSILRRDAEAPHVIPLKSSSHCIFEAGALQK